MRTILLSLTTLGAACATTPDPDAPPMESARASDLTIGAVPSTAAACLTRYTYPWLALRIDCATVHPGGDSGHWIMTCAVPAGFATQDTHRLERPPARYEATADAHGHLLHEAITPSLGPREADALPHDVTYAYDGDHRLTEIVQRDGAGAETLRLVVGARDADGNPLAAALTVRPLAPFGVPFPATAQIAHAYRYDDHGRLVADVGTYADGVVFYDEAIAYDDRALRRDRAIVVDLSGEIPGAGGPGRNARHELLDPAGRPLLTSQTTAGDPGPQLVAYRHDAEGRPLTTVTTRPDGFLGVVDYIYACP
jgi:hypothetical protein